jgi:hypothetical protein
MNERRSLSPPLSVMKEVQDDFNVVIVVDYDVA